MKAVVAAGCLHQIPFDIYIRRISDIEHLLYKYSILEHIYLSSTGPKSGASVNYFKQKNLKLEIFVFFK